MSTSQKQQQSPKTKPKHLRDPPPSLFLGPPSQNASHVSLPGTIPPPIPQNTSTLNPQRAPMFRTRSGLGPGGGVGAGTGAGAQETAGGLGVGGATGTANGGGSGATGPSRLGIPPALRHQESEGKRQADRTDALWAEMQSTLEEVELSAVNGTHVFGPEHANALEELRAAQIGLAQAWARSEADDVVEGADKESKGLIGLTGGSKGIGSEGRSVLDNTAGSTVSGTGRPGSSGVAGEIGAERMGSKLEEETEADILLARRRREANDRYFQRVNGGVLDVVAKLEEVAVAMRRVEQESRDIWGETESTGTSLHD